MNWFDKTLAKNAGTSLLLILVVVIVAGGSYYTGYRTGIQNPKEIVVKGITNINDPDVTADFALFWETWSKLKELHLKGDQIDDQESVYGAVEGLTASLGDPNTIFFRPVDSKKFEEDINGRFGGIGAEIGIQNEQLVIVSPLKDSPAERAGIKAKDIILVIDDLITSGITVDDAVKKIRGPLETDVVLTILHEGESSPKEITVTRGEIIIPTVDWEMVGDDNIIHVSLHSFNQNASFGFYEATVNALLNNSKGMILDLRNNPGGFLEVAVNLAGWFLDKGDVVAIERFRAQPDRIFRANGNGALKEFPLVILINGGSASASEILAGALRDQRNIKLIGDTSFGKGTVQELQPLQGGAKLKVTVANWLLPSEQIIEKNGLAPDFEVSITAEDVEALRDPQLEKAIEVLQEEIENSNNLFVNN